MGGDEPGVFIEKVRRSLIPGEQPKQPASHSIDGALALDILLCPEEASPWLPHPVPTDVALISRQHHPRP